MPPGALPKPKADQGKPVLKGKELSPVGSPSARGTSSSKSKEVSELEWWVPEVKDW